jgi:hypothetical protein
VPVVLMEAPITSAPGDLATGMLSPVTIDSSTSDSPSSTTASTGTLAPGRTSSRSPTWTSTVGTSKALPSRNTTATDGASGEEEAGLLSRVQRPLINPEDRGSTAHRRELS